MVARELMTPGPKTVTTEATIGEVWDLMREMDIRHVPVVDRGMLVGMLSDRDLAALDVSRALASGGAEAARRALLQRVVDVMSADVVCAEVDAELGDVIDLFLEYKVGAIPVVQPDTRELMGIISYVDVLRAVRDLLDET